GMRTGIQEVRAPAIMDRGARQTRQDADRIQGFFASLGVNCVVGESGCAGYLDPMAHAFHREPRFILMEHISFHQGFLEAFLDFPQVLSAALDQPRQRPSLIWAPTKSESTSQTRAQGKSC